MPTDATAIPALLNYDSAVDWQMLQVCEGPFFFGALALALLDVARFREIHCYGGFAGEPFDLDLSEELVLVAS